MGQDLVGSGHRRVTAFRDAWQQLPPHDTAPGRAAGPYGDVAETAKALLTAATRAARFAPADLQTLQTLQALQALATAADTHAARLSVTLPPGTSTPPRRAATVAACPSDDSDDRKATVRYEDLDRGGFPEDTIRIRMTFVEEGSNQPVDVLDRIVARVGVCIVDVVSMGPEPHPPLSEVPVLRQIERLRAAQGV